MEKLKTIRDFQSEGECLPLALPICTDEFVLDHFLPVEKGGILNETLAATSDRMQTSAVDGLVEFATGCVNELKGNTLGDNVKVVSISDKSKIRKLLSESSYKSLEHIAITGALVMTGNGMIEGVYGCPRNGCGEKITNELIILNDNEKDNIDTRDDYFNMEFNVGSKEDTTFDVSVDVEFATIGNVTSITFEHPKASTHVEAERNHRGPNNYRLKNLVYGYSIIAINGQSVDLKWRKTLGSSLIAKLSSDTIKEIVDNIKKFGLQPYFEKECPKCYKKWRQEVDPIGFFASALRG